MQKRIKIGVNSFVTRQVKGSPYSYHEDLTFKEICSLAAEYWTDRVPGFRDGVFLVKVLREGFVSGICKLADATVIESKFEPRRKGEEPVLVTRCNGSRLPATTVELVIYSKEALGADAETGEDFELVSINAGCGEPMTPTTMERNASGKAGGTETHYPESEWCRAASFWSQHAMAL
jgi:hypothetical protein